MMHWTYVNVLFSIIMGCYCKDKYDNEDYICDFTEGDDI